MKKVATAQGPQQWLTEQLRLFLHFVLWCLSHAYRIECAYRQFFDRSPIAYVKFEGRKMELAIHEYNGTAYLMEDGKWYGPQHIHGVVTLKWVSGGSTF